MAALYNDVYISNWKITIETMDLPIKNCDVPDGYVRTPEADDNKSGSK